MKYPMTPKRAARTVLVASAFGMFWGVAFVLAWAVFPLLALVLRDEVARIRTCQRILVPCFRFFHGYMRVLGLFDARFDFELARSDYTGPVVLVSNHTTLVDVTVLLTVLPHTCCIVNPLYFNNPLIGRAARLSGFIEGKTRAGHASALDVAQKRLAQGFHVLVFPEGTRSPPGGLLPFHRGAFEIAKRAQVPIVPLVLRCTPSALTKGQPMSQLPPGAAVLTVEPQPMIDTAAFSGTSRDLCRAVQESYHSALVVAKSGAGDLAYAAATPPP